MKGDATIILISYPGRVQRSFAEEMLYVEICQDKEKRFGLTHHQLECDDWFR